MRREQGAPDLLRAAEAAVAATWPDDGRPGLVHGDLWHGNTLWDDGRLTAVLDWDCAGVGPRATCPTGTPSGRSPPRRTWAGSRYRWPFRAAPT
jgi:phosphotransferase family enzyme